MTNNYRKNAYLYCKFRDEQYALYDDYAKKNGILMKTLLVLNALYYSKDGMTQKEICQRTFNSKQTVNLIIKNLLQEGYITIEEDTYDKRNKFVKMTDEGRDYAKIPVVHITWAEDTAMSMFTEEEQEQLINLSRKFTKNLTALINGGQEENEK
jgi:DNA-binding MarR family transcriptional regulator